MQNKVFDITVLTDSRYDQPTNPGPYEKNILLEDGLLVKALRSKGLKVNRTYWDNPTFDWSSTKSVIFRTTWDYFHRFDQFMEWMEDIRKQTLLINPYELLVWNIDKCYLRELEKMGLPIPPTLFIQTGEIKSLRQICKSTSWTEFILKPNVGGGGRLTYRFTLDTVDKIGTIFKEYIRQEAFLLQEFQYPILEKGEIALMVFGGKFSHAILKKAKPGDFRVQDDFGGTVHLYQPNPSEIELAEQAVRNCDPAPLYARVDMFWDNHGNPCLSELELIEPELWFRYHPESADMLADVLFEWLTIQ